MCRQQVIHLQSALNLMYGRGTKHYNSTHINVYQHPHCDIGLHITPLNGVEVWLRPLELSLG